MMMNLRLVCLLFLGLSLHVGCGGEEPFRKTTIPAKGKVTVDGKAPGSGIQIQCHSVAGLDTEHPTFSATETDADGNFSIATYTSGDGLPAGEYVLTFSWQDFNVISRSYSGEDKLNGKYSDPATSAFKISVKDGMELELTPFELTTM